MKKFYLSVILSGLLGVLAAQPFSSTWQKVANSTDFTWFTPTGNDVNSLDYNPVTDKLLVAKRGNSINVLNAATGAHEGTLNVTGITDGFRFSKIRVTSDGVIYAISLATGAGSVNIWRWANQDAAPALCATFTSTERCGDAFGLSGTGTSTILYASGAATASNAFSIYILNTVNGINFFLESKITMTSSPTTNQQWANRVVEPVTNSLTSDLWIKGGGFIARKIAVGPLSSGTRSGTVVATITDGVGNGEASVGYGGMRHLTSPKGNKYLIFSGGNNSYAGTKMKMINVTDEAAPVTFGIDSLGDPLGYVTNANGTGDAAYKFEGVGYTVFYLSTNNGLEATKASAQELPVAFAGLNVSIRNKTAVAEWSTLTESNNEGFAIEKSVNGINFSKIGFIGTKASNGNSSAALQYQFEDTKLLNGKSYYRIRQVDRDGKASYSQIKAIQYSNGLNLLTASVIANPIKDYLYLNVKAPSDKKIGIKLTNASGVILMNTMQNVEAGENNLTLPISNLPKGILFVSINDMGNNGQPMFFKVLKD